MEFTAIDFETANQARHSACAVALVRVKNGQVVDRFSTLIKPPPGEFIFTYIHGISHHTVREAKTFEQVWPQIQKFCNAAPFLAAHNASFDRGVLMSSCAFYGIEPAPYTFACTVKLSRSVWPHLPRHTLDTVCRYLKISLNHHQAESDAEACAKILLHAIKSGLPVDQLGIAAPKGRPPALSKLRDSSRNSKVPAIIERPTRRRPAAKKT